MNKILYRDHQFLYIDNPFKDIDIPSNKKIFDDYIKDTVIEDKEFPDDSTQPGMIIRRKGSLTSISMLTKRIPDYKEEESFTEEMNIQYSDASESEGEEHEKQK
mmetsp:Transcript_8157/g.7236  ORF Transcript_8157/g.7236 Transcript_8157/m.7236 type:complete len:104 (-) Transcript_8157:20-331(-)